MNIAPGVEFFEDRHEYWYKGKRLSGVTGLISKKLGQKMPQEFLEEHQEEGIHVHRAVQRWINTGNSGSVHPGVKWIVETLVDGFTRAPEQGVYSEALVSDFKQYASSVDIIGVDKDGALMICDIKKGLFKREYATWQLSLYKYFIEKYAKREVAECFCCCVKDREYYKIFPKPYAEVEKFLYGG
jgi:hypothetical protein